MKKYVPVCYFFFVSWYCISLGLHVCFSPFNFEIHIPFGFFRVGFSKKLLAIPKNNSEIQKKVFGIDNTWWKEREV